MSSEKKEVKLSLLDYMSGSVSLLSQEGQDQHPTQNIVWVLRLLMPLMQHMSIVIIINHIMCLPRENMSLPSRSLNILREQEKRLALAFITVKQWGQGKQFQALASARLLQLSISLREEPWNWVSWSRSGKGRAWGRGVGDFKAVSNHEKLNKAF